MREGAATIRVTQRPDMRQIGTELIIDANKATRINRYTCLVEAQIVSVGGAPDGKQQMRALNFLRGICVADTHRHALIFAGNGQVFRIALHHNPFCFQNRLNGRRHGFIFTRNQSWPGLDDRHAAAKATVGLCKLQADIAAANNDQMLRQKIDVHHAGIGEVVHPTQARNIRHRSTSADIDKNLASFQQHIVHPHGMGTFKTTMALNNGEVGRTF